MLVHIRHIILRYQATGSSRHCVGAETILEVRCAGQGRNIHAQIELYRDAYLHVRARQAAHYLVLVHGVHICVVLLLDVQQQGSSARL